MSAFDQCREVGIRLNSYSLGEHRTTCPKCSHLRKKVHQKTPCLAVAIRTDCVLAYCHHCGWEFGKKNDSETFFKNRNQSRRPSSPRSLYR